MKRVKLFLLMSIFCFVLVGCKKEKPTPPPIVVPNVESVEIINEETTLGVGDHEIFTKVLPEDSNQQVRLEMIEGVEGVSFDGLKVTISPDAEDGKEIKIKAISLSDETKTTIKVFLVSNKKEKTIIINNENLVIDVKEVDEIIIDATLINGSEEDILLYEMKEDVLGVSINGNVVSLTTEVVHLSTFTVIVNLKGTDIKKETTFTIHNEIIIDNIVEIRTEEEFKAISLLNMEEGEKTYKLMNNIILEGWFVEPIGNDEHPFKGTFDGQGYTISGFKGGDGENNFGIFGVIGSTGVIRNVSLKGAERDVDFYRGNNSAFLASKNYGLVENVYVEGSIMSLGALVAGVVAENYGTIRCVISRVKVYKNDDFVPGTAFVLLNQGTLENVFVDKEYTNSQLFLSIPSVYDENNLIDVEAFTNETTYKAFDKNIWFIESGFYPALKHEGFIVPTEKIKVIKIRNEKLTINFVEENSLIVDAYLVNKDSEDVLSYALKEEVLGVLITGNKVTLTSEVTHLSTFTVLITFEGTDINKEVTFTIRNNPEIANTVVEIKTEAEFMALGLTSEDGLEKKYKLMNDINLEGWYLNPIGNEITPFMGMFDGQGYTISGFKGGDGENNFGIFGVIGSTGVIKNVSLKGAERTVDFYRGNNSAFLASKNYGLIENVYLEAIVMSPRDLIAGVVAENYGTIRYVVSRVKVYKNDDFVPGAAFTLLNQGTISDVYVDKEYTGLMTFFNKPSNLDENLLTTNAFLSASTYANFNLIIWEITDRQIPRLIPNIEKFDPDANLDLENVFFDDFTNGINPNVWEIAHRRWGVHADNGGVIIDNVNYTADGVVVLQANGDNYVGPLKGIERDNGRRTGATLVTNKALGPGRFEVRMKILPRFGATSAMWTFFYLKDGDQELNHEIDIELNVNNDFRTFWVTNWISETNKNHSNIITDVVNNDGEYHIYKFEWHTNPERIDFYVDDILVYTSTENIPNHAGRFWIGHWFPDGWAGEPDFETDYMFVDWVRYTPYLNNPYIKTNDGQTNLAHLYPTSPIKEPVNNLISNPSFEGLETAWQKDINSNSSIVNEGINNTKAMCVPNNDAVYQLITGIDETFEFVLVGKVKLNNVIDKGQILVEFLTNEGTFIDSVLLEFNKDDPNFVLGEYYEKTITFTTKPGTKQIKVSLSGSGETGALFDDLYLNLTKKPYSLYLAQFE